MTKCYQLTPLSFKGLMQRLPTIMIHQCMQYWTPAKQLRLAMHYSACTVWSASDSFIWQNLPWNFYKRSVSTWQLQTLR